MNQQNEGAAPSRELGAEQFLDQYPDNWVLNYVPRVKEIEVVKSDDPRNIRYELQMADGWVHSAEDRTSSEAIVRCVNHMLEHYLIVPFPSEAQRLGRSILALKAG